MPDKPIKIIVTGEEGEYRACIADKYRHCRPGLSVSEAIGNLVWFCGLLFGVEVDTSNAHPPKPTPEFDRS